MRHLFPSILLALISIAGLRAASREIIVYDEMTPAGKAALKAVVGRPTVYLLQLGGYKQIQDTTAGEKAPAPEEVAKQVHAALMAQGLDPLRTTSKIKPDIFIVVHWGYMGPGDVDMGDGFGTVSFNEEKMVSLVAGSSMNQYDLSSLKRTELIQSAHDVRYFVVLSAYDFPAMEQHKKVLLWQARMSTPVNGTDLPAILPLLAKSGVGIFGKVTPEAKQLIVSDVPQGRVEVGTPVTVEAKPKPTAP